MRSVYVLLVLAVVITAVSAQGGRCTKRAEKAKEKGLEVPECDEDGNFVPKQCNATLCWCVKKRSGRPNFGGLQVPLNHEYDCTRRPKPCVQETLELLVAGVTDEFRLPDCTNRGMYKPIQCEKVARSNCRNQRKKRQLPAGPCAAPGTTGFFNLTAPLLVDVAEKWTFVQKTSDVTFDGEVTSIELNVMAENRTIIFGVFKKLADPCQFLLMQTFTWMSTVLGFNVIELDMGQRLSVETGDMLGFMFMGQGVIGYTNVDPQNYCEDNLAFTVGDTATLVAGRFGNREYDVRFVIGGESQYVGFDPVARDNVDAGNEWTFVSKTPFPSEGQIKAIELYVAAVNRTIRFGVYRDTGTTGEFKLIKQIEYAAGFPHLGFMRIVPVTALDVQEGDNFGFTWTAKGVIAYELSQYTNYFYHTQHAYNEGETTAVMLDGHGKRIYSLQVEFVSCGGLSARGGPCLECYCVEKDGTEKNGTRTTDRDSLECSAC